MAEADCETNIELSKEEEECIAETGVSRRAVLQDKGYKLPGEPIYDPKFVEYLDCYRKKLDKLGKLCYTKSTHVQIPGYKTRARVPGIYCTEEDLCGCGPERQYAISPEFQMMKNK